MSKLTLSVDHNLIDAAKAYAKAHKTSLSQLVARQFIELTAQPADTFFTTLHEELLRDGFQVPAPDPSQPDSSAISRRRQ